MVVIADKMQQPVHDYPIQFIGKLRPVKGGVLLHGINADEKVSGEAVSLTIIESDNVGIIIVLQIFYIDVQNIIIGAKYYSNVTEALGLALRNKLEPTGSKTLLFKCKRSIFGKICNHKDKICGKIRDKSGINQMKISIFEVNNT